MSEASDIRRRPGQCEGKFKFESPALAKAVTSRKNKRRGSLDAYRCAICNFWHVGGKIRTIHNNLVKRHHLAELQGDQ